MAYNFQMEFLISDHCAWYAKRLNKVLLPQKFVEKKQGYLLDISRM